MERVKRGKRMEYRQIEMDGGKKESARRRKGQRNKMARDKLSDGSVVLLAKSFHD